MGLYEKTVETFEKLLRNKLNTLLAHDNPAGISSDYRSFLEATKADIAKAHGGYFAKDWGEPDDSSAAEERDDILHKERTLPFKKENGSWNTRRFFFSKWTLREGWDNPNVFTICKLRTSGSEISKIQEVGRGLRLPVDEMGNRLRGSQWKLNYIIGWDERDFAEKLIGEINADAKVVLNRDRLTDLMIEIICQNRKIETNALLTLLDKEKIINRDNSFTENGYERLLELYPELLQTQIRKGKVESSGRKEQRPQIKLRKNNWNLLADSWNKLSKRYLLTLERLQKKELSQLAYETFSSQGVFDTKSATLTVKTLEKGVEADELRLATKEIFVNDNQQIDHLDYGEFVKRFAYRSGLSVELIHLSLWRALKEKIANGMGKKEVNKLFNLNTLEKSLAAWDEKFCETYAAKYNYYPLEFEAETLVVKDGSFVDQIEVGLVGVIIDNTMTDDPRNLYDKPHAYDSELEREIQLLTPDKNILVFGKIPRRAIKVPTYTGGSTTPDFVYYVSDEKSSYGSSDVKEKETEEISGKVNTAGRLTLLVETKGSDMRLSERRVVKAQEKMFKNIPGVKWQLITSADELGSLLASLHE